MAARNLFKSGKVLVPRTQLSFEDGSLYVYLQLKYLLFLRLLAYEMEIGGMLSKFKKMDSDAFCLARAAHISRREILRKKILQMAHLSQNVRKMLFLSPCYH